MFDAEILAKAVQEKYILITLDEDFGDWAVLPLKNHPGVVRLKVNPATTETIGALLLAFLEVHGASDFAGHYGKKAEYLFSHESARIHTNRSSGKIKVRFVAVKAFDFPPVKRLPAPYCAFL
jgi:hypothetical protein